MSSACRDNWERLMAIVLKRQQYLELCNKPHSRSPSTSTISSDFSEESLSQELGFVSQFPFPQRPSLSQAVGNNTITRRLFSPWYQSRKMESPLEILRPTSLADASDAVWDRFLPSDLLQIVSRSVSPVVYANKKELYSRLCHSPILIDAGKLSFCLEKESGKKCYMVGASDLRIIWCGDSPQYWDLVSDKNSRFSKVAVLKSVCWLEIQGTIDTRMLSSNTIYGAYLVFKLDDRKAYGLKSANAFVRFTEDKVDGGDTRNAILHHFNQENARNRHRRRTRKAPVRIGDGLTEIVAVHLQAATGSQQQHSGRVAVRRSDEWMEVELGSFYRDGGDDGTVETWLLGTEGRQWKSGLIVQGIEFRPKP
ncbi:F-box protein PP2-B10-like isoform X1 [Salvia miltiorrhiza]|uniref:F-box protein PP2-B10-like isoform X1 n=1 Tax=Salvia miltiorrhiza TaxID=226208 RepID=UPI0025AC1B18|nr:F-box protein PP2-B10-like isoform X1 [Salvia miltiorrhiza]